MVVASFITSSGLALLADLCPCLSLTLLAKEGVLLIPIPEVESSHAVLRVKLLVFVVCFVCYGLRFLLPVYDGESDFLSDGLLGPD
jgi:hypothetical protein